MKKSIWKAWSFLVIALAVVLCNAILEGMISVYIMKMIDATLSKNNSLLIGNTRKLLFASIILLPASILLSYTRGLFKLKSLTSMKKTFIEKIFHKNINEFQKDNHAKYVSSLTNDMNTMEMNYISAVYEIGFNIIYFIVGFIVIASVSLYALCIGITIGVISSIISIVISKPLQKHQNQRSSLFEGYTTYIKEVLSAFQIIKSNNLNDKIQQEFYKKSKDIQHKGYAIDKLYTYILSIQHFTIYLSYFSLVTAVVFMSIKGYLTFGAIILIVNNMNKVLEPLMQCSEWIPKLLSVKTLFNKIDDVLTNHDNYNETINIDSYKDSIQFKDVSFSYDNNEVLKHINFTINKGEKYLVVGPSGGGKSTLLKLLRKYYVPKEGKILIDNLNLKDVKKESYFKNISNVEQQVFLFEDTLRNNLTLYKDYYDDEITLALERAGLRDFVKGLPKGLDSMILDNGKNISGGEKSRIAIARGLLEKKDIIFLDEAFASLDANIAKEIENTLLKLEGITVVNVSHVIFKETRKKYHKVLIVKNKGIFESA